MSESPEANVTALPTAGPRGNPLKLPAILLMATSGLTMLYGVASLCVGLAADGVDPDSGGAAFEQPMALAFAAAIPVVNLVVLLGSVAMVRLRHKRLAFAGAIAAVAPIVGPCFLVGIPLGIWALAMLTRGDINARFDGNRGGL